MQKKKFTFLQRCGTHLDDEFAFSSVNMEISVSLRTDVSSIVNMWRRYGDEYEEYARKHAHETDTQCIRRSYFSHRERELKIERARCVCVCVCVIQTYFLCLSCPVTFSSFCTSKKERGNGKCARDWANRVGIFLDTSECLMACERCDKSKTSIEEQEMSMNCRCEAVSCARLNSVYHSF